MNLSSSQEYQHQKKMNAQLVQNVKKKLFEKNIMTFSQRKLKGLDYFISLPGGNSGWCTWTIGYGICH